MKKITVVLILIVTGFACGKDKASAQSDEYQIWQEQKQSLYRAYEKLVLPPVGTDSKEVMKVFAGNAKEQKNKGSDISQLTIPFFLNADQPDHPRTKMYSFIHVTVEKGRVTKSSMRFTGPSPMIIDGKPVKDMFEVDSKLVGILKGYLRWKGRLLKASWNKTADKGK